MEKHGKVLIVDDDTGYLQSLRSILGNEFEVKAASTLKEAKRLMSDEIDALLLDIRLDENDPRNTDGIMLLEWVKKNHAGVRVVMMSSYRDLDEQCRTLGAEEFLTKPMSIKELRDTLRRLIGGQQKKGQ